jgi:hypothetical protein
LDPVLVTGSSVLVDDDLAPRLTEAARQWLSSRGYDVQIQDDHEEGFHVLSGQGADWCPRVYVHLLTDLFQQGLTRCLVGTRGLLGEGWDASRINVLIDLTTVTTSMSVNQLHGRSLRLDPHDSEKVANNWDVVCVAPEFAKGLDDYGRFRRKHKTLFGVTDDGAVEKGVGHVHAAFAEMKPEALEHSISVLNADMLRRAGNRSHARQLWRIGEPYHPEPVCTLEVGTSGMGGGFPPIGRSGDPWSGATLTEAIGTAVLGALRQAGLVSRCGEVQLSSRTGGYMRVFLKQATAEEGAIFTQALEEALGSLNRPRYVISRHVEHVEETWLSRLLPEVVSHYFQRRRQQFVMLHAVPAVLAKNISLARIYQQHWNRHVSPGEALFAHRGRGEQLLLEAKQKSLVPQNSVTQQEVFLCGEVFSDDGATTPGE